MTTRELYSRYVGNGFADTDGYFAPISFEAFSALSESLQESFAGVVRKAMVADLRR